jgi:uncharacterized membrane protein YfcA
MLAPDAGVVAAAAAVIFAAALVSSVVGFAFSALAAAALLRLFDDPLRTVTVMVICSIGTQAYGVWRLRKVIEWRGLLPFLAGGAITVPLGIGILIAMPSTRAFSVALGTLVIAYGIYMFFRSAPPLLAGGTSSNVLAGALGGVVGGFAGFPGSFVTIWCGMRGWSKERQRGVYEPFILAMQLEALGLLALRSPAPLYTDALVLYVTVALVAAFIGVALFGRISTRQFNRIVYLLLVASGVSLLGGAI